MSSTITALFDTRAEAEAAKDRLDSANIDTSNVHVHDKSSTGYNEQSYSTHEDRGIWDSIKNAFAPDEDRHAYEEGIRRGGALLTADVDDDHVDEAVRVLEEANSVDIDDRTSEWRTQGWDYQNTPRTGTASAFGGFGKTDTDPDYDRDRNTLAEGNDREEVIPIVEETLVVGKRDVDRGGARVRSYITETPVSEQIRLRNERVNVERRAVDQPLSATDGDAFRERTIDMTATGEEAVIGKDARVVEEVVISKTTDERVETVHDTVRKTEVDIDRDGDRDGDRNVDRDTAFGTTTSKTDRF